MSTKALNYKARLAQLGKTQTDLQRALADRGYDVEYKNLTRYVNGTVAPRDPHIMGTINLIILRWEKNAQEEEW